MLCLSRTGSSAFARHYLRNLGWFLFLRVLRWFSSPGSLLLSYVFRLGYTLLCGFPHSDIAVSMLFCQLHRAFRRLTRPSSPIIAKASTWCTYSLDSIIWRTFWLHKHWRWQPTLLRFSNLTKLTTLLCIVLAFCLSRTIDTIITQILVICLFLLSVPIPFSGCLKCEYCLLQQTAF